jgi:hypothetical protein
MWITFWALESTTGTKSLKRVELTREITGGNMTYQRVSIQILMGRNPGKNQGLLYPLTVGEALIIANRPSVTADLLWLNPHFSG